MKIVVDVNNLIPFKLTLDEVTDWSRQIDRIAPGIDLKALRFIMDAFATEALPYDRNKGIQNIFIALKRVDKSPEGYRIIRKSWL